jgi:sigma-B regulation protein RsbU (phosphoserine phosphatase)
MAAVVQLPRVRNVEELQQLCARLSAAPDLSTLLHTAAFQLRRLLGCSVVIFTKPGGEPTYVATATIGVPQEELAGIRFTPADAVLSLAEMGPVSPDRIPASEWRRLEAARAAFIVPVRRRRELIGFLVLGQTPHEVMFDAVDRELLEGVAGHLAMCIENFRLRDQDLEFARVRELQERLLPNTAVDMDGFDIAHAWRPARSVSGDYFDVLELGGGKVGLCIADVVGKGMPAALLMSNVQAAVKAVASDSMPAHEVCERVNRVLAGNLAAGSFVTMFYGVLDCETRRLRYTNAGHVPPFAVRAQGALERLERGGALLGVFRNWAFEEGEIVLEPGDRVVLYTDGITELHNTGDEEFGEERLGRLLRDHRALGAAGLKDAIVNNLVDFNNGLFQDDLTVVVLAANDR